MASRIFTNVLNRVYSEFGRNIPQKTRAPKKYLINLDLPPDQRWLEVAKDHADYLKEINAPIRSNVPKVCFTLLDKVVSEIDNRLPAPYVEEMKGIAAATGIDIGEIVLANLWYDIATGCTSIVSEDSKGQIWHSRNLDYRIGPSILRKLTVAVDFQKKGETIYNGTTFAGYVGLPTGQKPNAFTISVDQRDEGNALENLLVGLLDKTVVPVSFLVRDVLSGTPDYNAAVDKLANTDTAAPVYLIIGGAKSGEAAVITKNRLTPHDVWKIEPDKGRWFEVQTNYDHWLPPPKEDDRRNPAIKAMEAMGRENISVQSLFKVMSTVPVLNYKTAYTTVMSAVKPELMQSWVRE